MQGETLDKLWDECVVGLALLEVQSESC